MHEIAEQYLGRQTTFCRLGERLYGQHDILHTDGCGTKSVVAVNKYKRTGDLSVFTGLVIDSINMNLNDIACVGAVDGIVNIVTTLNIHSSFGDEVVRTIIAATQDYCDFITDTTSMTLVNCGGETAYVDYLTDGVILDHTVSTTIKAGEVIDTTNIKEGMAIVGLASFTATNSGMGSNGISAILNDCADPSTTLLANGMTVEDAILCPTINYVETLCAIMDTVNYWYRTIGGIIHCTGGGVNKSKKFENGLRFEKDSLFDPPPLFERYNDRDTFNMGHLIEIYCDPEVVDRVIAVGIDRGIPTKVIGRVLKGL